MTGALAQRIESQLNASVKPEVSEFAMALAHDAGAIVVLFYGSNLRTGSLDGVLDFYLLMPGQMAGEARIWPRVSYHERDTDEGITLRAKVATMRLETFRKAASGELTDTTIWARFVQPSALIWATNEEVERGVTASVAAACVTAAKLAVALGPERGEVEDYWRALFRATYKAEFRVEKSGRENDILSVNAEHFADLLPQALEAAEIEFVWDADRLVPKLSTSEKRKTLRWWNTRRRMGKPLNFVRLMKASTTFEGAARYAAWKIERHTGMPVEVTPFRERFPLLAAPSVLWSLWRHRRKTKRL